MVSGTTAPTDYHEQQAQEPTSYVLAFVMTGRYQIELSAGGNSTSTVGVDHRSLLARSGQLAQASALYKESGLDLDADLAP